MDTSKCVDGTLNSLESQIWYHTISENLIYMQNNTGQYSLQNYFLMKCPLIRKQKEGRVNSSSWGKAIDGYLLNVKIGTVPKYGI